MGKIDVHSGEIGFTGDSSAVMTTVVGVCIALIIWDKKHRRGGMCHYRLPVVQDALAGNNPHDFGSTAIVSLLKRFKESGSEVSDLEARIIGGGHIHYGGYMRDQNIGEQNARVAVALLQYYSIPLKGRAVGGSLGRQIRFEVETGHVAYKEFDCVGDSQLNMQLAEEESSIEEVNPNILNRVDEFLKMLQDQQRDCLPEPDSITDFLEKSQRSYHRSALIVIGASTGGVEALSDLIQRLPPVTPPICLVQHIPKNFSNSLARNINKNSPLTVSEAIDGAELQDSHVYIAPGDKHFKLVQLPGDRLISRLSMDPPMNGFRPSIDYLFNSVRRIEHRKIAGVLMTGMGTDGANGMLELKKKGAYTIVQNKDTSVVWGMAGEAVRIGATCRTAPLIAIPQLIMEAVK